MTDLPDEAIEKMIAALAAALREEAVAALAYFVYPCEKMDEETFEDIPIPGELAYDGTMNIERVAAKLLAADPLRAKIGSRAVDAIMADGAAVLSMSIVETTGLKWRRLDTPTLSKTETVAPEQSSVVPAAKGGYAPGNYTCKCFDCGAEFIGAKRAGRCAECADQSTLAKNATAVPEPVAPEGGE